MAIGSCETWIGADGKELLEHGTALFPAAFYYDDIAENPVPWHWHEELEVGYVIRGSIRICIDAEEYILKEGEGFFVNSGVLHGLWEAKEEVGETNSIVFHPRLVGGSPDSIYWQQYIQPLLENSSLKGVKLMPETDWHQEVMETLKNGWEAGVKEPDGFEFEVRNTLSRIIYLVTKYEKTTETKVSPKVARDGLRIKKMLQYIKDHYQEEITIAQIADNAGISESECLRCFRNTINTTPIRFLKTYRLQMASYLLKTTEQKIVDIGVQCGFQDMSYFAKTFRAVYGCTPTEYRTKIKVP